MATDPHFRRKTWAHKALPPPPNMTCAGCGAKPESTLELQGGYVSGHWQYAPVCGHCATYYRNLPTVDARLWFLRQLDDQLDRRNARLSRS